MRLTYPIFEVMEDRCQIVEANINEVHAQLGFQMNWMVHALHVFLSFQTKFVKVLLRLFISECLRRKGSVYNGIEQSLNADYHCHL